MKTVHEYEAEDIVVTDPREPETEARDSERRAAPLDAERLREALAETLHDAMCDVSHHDRDRRCSRWPKYPQIAASVAPRLAARLRAIPASTDPPAADGMGVAVMLRQWAGSVDRLLASAPIDAVVNETGIPATSHTTPPERAAQRAAARDVASSWLARDLDRLRVALAASPPEGAATVSETAIEPEVLDDIWTNTGGVSLRVARTETGELRVELTRGVNEKATVAVTLTGHRAHRLGQVIARNWPTPDRSR